MSAGELEESAEDDDHFHASLASITSDRAGSICVAFVHICRACGGDGWRWAPMHTPKSRRGGRAAIWRRRGISHARPVSLTHVMSAQ